jgi:hypothetical protein
MILEPGKDTYTVKDVGTIHRCYIRIPGTSYEVEVHNISPAEWVEVREKKQPPYSLRGTPTSFAMLEGNVIALFPCPDKDYKMVILYSPPMRMM